MQIIRQRHPHGVYSGSIGFFAPRDDAVFNVAIHTIVSHKTGNVQEELEVELSEILIRKRNILNAECRFKCAFLNLSSAPIQLIETILREGRHRPPDPCFVYQKIQRFLVSLRDSVVKRLRSRDEGGSHNASITGNIHTPLSK
jgi:hypothetical protein